MVNVSEGRDRAALDELAEAAGTCLLDRHADPDHHRSVLTLGSVDPDALEGAARAVARTAVRVVDLRQHRGVHPRFGAVDVVPFVPLTGPSPLVGGGDLGPALAARGRFAHFAADELALPCFFYGPERSLPDVRRGAFSTLLPDTGPSRPHPSAGACAVGARAALVAWNLWLIGADPELAGQVAARLRGPAVRALGLAVTGGAQVSCNLVDPLVAGPADVYDRVVDMLRGTGARVDRTETVGLVPDAVLRATPRGRWVELDLDPQRTVEERLGGAEELRTPKRSPRPGD